MSAGYNQIWLMPKDAKTGQPAKVEGRGMTALFVQLADGKANTRNVSSSCDATGTVTFDDLPTKAGGKAKGCIDVTIQCESVKGLDGPLVIKGKFSEVPRK